MSASWVHTTALLQISAKMRREDTSVKRSFLLMLTVSRVIGRPMGLAKVKDLNQRGKSDNYQK